VHSAYYTGPENSAVAARRYVAYLFQNVFSKELMLYDARVQQLIFAVVWPQISKKLLVQQAFKKKRLHK